MAALRTVTATAGGLLFHGQLLLSLRWVAVSRYGVAPAQVDRFFLVAFGAVLVFAAALHALVRLWSGRPGVLAPAYALAVAGAAATGGVSLALGGNPATAVLFGFLPLGGAVLLMRSWFSRW